AEAGSEALDLPLDHLRAIHDRPRGNVAIGVARVLAGRRPGVVELALLHEQHEGSLRMLAAPDGGLTGRDLLERAAEMDGPGLQASGVWPRDRSVERPVDLEGAGAVAVAAEPAHVARGKDRSADVGELRRTGVEEHDAGGGKIRERPNEATGLDGSAEDSQV